MTFYTINPLRTVIEHPNAQTILTILFSTHTMKDKIELLKPYNFDYEEENKILKFIHPTIN